MDEQEFDVELKPKIADMRMYLRSSTSFWEMLPTKLHSPTDTAYCSSTGYTAPPTQPTAPSTGYTAPPTQPTAPSSQYPPGTQPTAPSTGYTAPPTQPTAPSSQYPPGTLPTTPPTLYSAPPAQPTSQPTQYPTTITYSQPTAPPTRYTASPTVPTAPPTTTPDITTSDGVQYTIGQCAAVLDNMADESDQSDRNNSSLFRRAESALQLTRNLYFDNYTVQQLQGNMRRMRNAAAQYYSQCRRRSLSPNIYGRLNSVFDVNANWFNSVNLLLRVSRLQSVFDAVSTCIEDYCGRDD
ncbi:hypothetical protein OESDEN_10170 [Oesophagostomum dentatum]|uniref:Uncharacterized protein n=1 Tax=Oesophagostomum dentatum TaxID=61180 RepID=A0A0B1T1G2_OESDE|nr:hypothetical protein OESDEN_10170 [Oesophagostomum dentatum]